MKTGCCSNMAKCQPSREFAMQALKQTCACQPGISPFDPGADQDVARHRLPLVDPKLTWTSGDVRFAPLLGNSRHPNAP